MRCFLLGSHLYQNAGDLASINVHVIWRFNCRCERKFVLNRIENGFGRPGSELRRTREIDLRPQKNRKPKSFSCCRFPSIAALPPPGGLVSRQTNETLLGTWIRDLQNRIACRARLLEGNNLPADYTAGEFGLQ